MSVKDRIGETYGRLTVASLAPKPWQAADAEWVCMCECGSEAVVRACDLNSGRTKSCGCLRRQSARERQHVHGHKGTPTYKSWASMKQRVLNSNADNYSRYGGRGITICERWMQFANFLEDMGERPEGMTLDRIDVEGNYEPGNVRWATVSEQNSNRRPK